MNQSHLLLELSTHNLVYWLFFNNAKASLCIQMRAAVLFMLKSLWLNWRELIQIQNN